MSKVSGILSLTLTLMILLSCNGDTPQQSSKSMEKPQKPIEPAKVELAYQYEAKLGEGAYWNHATQTFWWIDIEGKQFNIYDPKTGTNTVNLLKTRPGTVVPSTSGNAILATEEGILDFDLATKDYTIINPVESDNPKNRLNDGKCDPAGRLWVGSMNFNTVDPTGSLYMIEQGKSTKVLEGITISNGIVWTKDKKTMYYIDTPTAKIVAYDYDNNTGKITNGRTAVEVPKTMGFPDGMAIDASGNLWVGMWNGDAVINYDPQTGNVIQKIPVPAHNVTACAFGGPNLDTLYITTARVDMTDEELEAKPLSGSLFSYRPGVKGVKSDVYRY